MNACMPIDKYNLQATAYMATMPDTYLRRYISLNISICLLFYIFYLCFLLINRIRIRLFGK